APRRRRHALRRHRCGLRRAPPGCGPFGLSGRPGGVAVETRGRCRQCRYRWWHRPARPRLRRRLERRSRPERRGDRSRRDRRSAGSRRGQSRTGRVLRRAGGHRCRRRQASTRDHSSATRWSSFMTPKKIRLVIATANRGKVNEFEDALVRLNLELLDLSAVGIAALPDETGSNYEENALLKAGYVALRSGLPALADDSGLEVDA